jgi:hypothetical protein
MLNKQAAAICILFISFSFSVSGQKSVNSPYARYNLGVLEPAGSFRSAAMGGLSAAIRDNSAIYYLNPASYSSIDTNSFVFDFGLDYGINYLSDGTKTHFTNDMNFDHLMIGFPVAKGVGIAAGLVPFSNGYYNISETVGSEDPGYDPVKGGYLSVHSGEGSVSRFFIGAGTNISRYFSAGINLSLLFGSINRLNETDFTDFYYMYHNNTTEKIQLTGINLDYGIQLMAPLKNNYFLNAGVSYTSARNYSQRYEKLTYLFSAYNTVDTLAHEIDSSRAYIPGAIRAGISFGKKNKFTVGFDYSASEWSQAVISSSGASFGDTRSYRLGIEYIPDKFSNYSLGRRIEYRAGGHLENTYLQINGEQVKEIGFSLGVGIPMTRTLSIVASRNLSKANFFFDYSKRSGPAGSALHTEHIFTIGTSLNFYDFWFLKRKYD